MSDWQVPLQFILLYLPISRFFNARIASLKSLCAVCLVRVTSKFPYSLDPCEGQYLRVNVALKE